MSGADRELFALTKSADDTRQVGVELAAVVEAGDIVVLAGDLGAGKTTLTQGLGKGLGVAEQVTSPTFTLLRPYDGRLRLLHADIYRLDRLQEVVDLGLMEQLDDKAVACIEWGDLAEPVLPADFLEIRIRYTDADDERFLRLRTVGPRWSGRRDRLERMLARWLVSFDGGDE